MKKFLIFIGLLIMAFSVQSQSTYSVEYHRANKTYNIGSLVSSNGIIYRATTQNINDTPPSANWVQATETGSSISLPATEIGYGNGSTIVSSPNFTYGSNQLTVKSSFWDSAEKVRFSFENASNTEISYLEHEAGALGGLRIRNTANTTTAEDDVQIYSLNGDLDIGTPAGNTSVSLPFDGSGSFTVGSFFGPVLSVDTTAVTMPRVAISEIDGAGNRAVTSVEWVQNYVTNNAPDPVAPAGEMVFGTGTGITSDPRVTYDSTGNQVTMDTLNVERISLDTNDGEIYKRGFPFLHETDEDNTYPSLWVGSYAGNNLAASGVDGNVGVGSYAGSAITTGGQNTAVGAGALASIDDDNYNTAIGSNTLFFLTDGNDNAAIGKNAFQNLTTGSNNFALGRNAGFWFGGTGGTALTQGNQLVLIGDSALPLGNNETNEIVIGGNTVGAGSNSVRIGNDDITAYRVSSTYTPVANNDLLTKGYGDANYAGGGPEGIFTFSATTPYTTVSAQNGYHVVLSGTATTITLDDAGMSLDEQITFYNKTGGNVTWAFGTGDTAYQGTPANLADGEYAWVTLEAANLWSVQVGGGGGGTDILPLDNAFTGTNTFSTNLATQFYHGSGNNAGSGGRIYIGHGGGAVHEVRGVVEGATDKYLSIFSVDELGGGSTFNFRNEATQDDDVLTKGYADLLYGGSVNLLPLNNTWTGTNLFENTVTVDNQMFIQNGDNNSGGVSELYFGGGNGWTQTFASTANQLSLLVGSTSTNFQWRENTWDFQAPAPQIFLDGSLGSVVSQGTITMLDTGSGDMKFELTGTADYSFFAGGTEQFRISDNDLVTVLNDASFSGDINMNSTNSKIGFNVVGGVDALSSYTEYTSRQINQGFYDTALNYALTDESYDDLLGWKMGVVQFGAETDFFAMYYGGAAGDEFTWNNLTSMNFDNTIVFGTAYKLNTVGATSTVNQYGEVVKCTNAAGITLTISDAATEPDGAQVTIIAYGAGDVTIAVGGTATLNGAGTSLTITGKSGQTVNSVQLIQDGDNSDDWIVIGSYN